ncbi:MAG: peroxiredoxin family protein [Ignavibacteria bacterium]|nr:peroxiredoxin family protein [Ignavibacteria bacterium]
MKRALIKNISTVFIVLSFSTITAQLQPALLDQQMKDFSMPSFEGKTVSLYDYKGKNVLIVFPRGYAAEGRWCSICNYQYAQMLDLFKKASQKYNLQILYVFPYSEEKSQAWIDAMPDQMVAIEEMKNPKDNTERSLRRAEFAKNYFTEKYEFKKGEVPTPFPILIDSSRTVSKSLGLFMTEWGGSKVDQNIPAVYLLDKNGVLKFKYIGQSTTDRPSTKYLINVMEKLL